MLPAVLIRICQERLPDDPPVSLCVMMTSNIASSNDIKSGSVDHSESGLVSGQSKLKVVSSGEAMHSDVSYPTYDSRISISNASSNEISSGDSTGAGEGELVGGGVGLLLGAPGPLV